MSTTKTKVDPSIIESFLNGNNPKKYVVAIEAGYSEPSVSLVINDPIKGKRIENQSYKPFLWFKADVIDMLYGGKKMKAIQAGEKYGVKSKRLKISDADGNTPERLANGYTYLATCTKSYNNLIGFFKEGGIDVFDKAYSKLFFMFTPVEQFMIQTGVRLFKGMEDYEDIHRLQFDLETEGLSGKNDAIFQIGIRDNRGFEIVLETIGDTPQEKRDSERENLYTFFKIIDEIKPDVITGYNSESFDWKFIVDRAERLMKTMDNIYLPLDRKTPFKRKPSMLKLGNEQETFEQTYMWGYNVIDIAHSVRRAQAINSDIKSWGLKYITQYSNIAKENRIYVPGDKIHATWSDKENQYAFNDIDGDWYKISERMPLKEGYQIVTGAYIVQRYLLDDLWETEQIDTIFNQAAFLIAKMLPTTYSRSATMGTASQWKLIMSAWSYENNLAIPETEPKREFTGGLSRLLELGYARNVVKLDYAALYPKNQLTHDIFPDLDISGVMEGMLTYVVDTRDKFKFLTGEHKGIAKGLQKDYDKTPVEQLKEELKKQKALANLYDKKQLPLKILANSWFGAYGAPYIFNWGDSDCAEETTCRGRQYLRLMVKHFSEKYGFKALVGDSVTFDTPVYIRYKSQKNYIDVLPICDLFNENSEFLDADKFRDFEKKTFEVLTRNGWKDIKYVYRHETNKNIHRITTKDRLINVTEDHSLFQNGKEIKPSELKRFDGIDTYEIPKNNVATSLNVNKAYLGGFFLGDGSANCSSRTQKYKSIKTGEIHTNKGKRSDWKISNSRIELLEKLRTILKDEYSIDGVIKNNMKSSGVYNLIVHDVDFTNNFCEHFYTSYREKKIPYMILNASEDIKKAFIEGVFGSDGYGDTIEDCSDIGMKSQIAMAGISLLLKELNIEYKIKTRSDKQNFISFSLKNRNRNNSSFTDKTKKKTNEVWKNEIILNKDKNNFVYDISTEDGTFICGINGIIAHNTDGFNFSFPDNINDVKYLAKGSHWKTEKDAGKELVGLDAVLAEFNENYMIGRMGLDIDDICNSTINFSRKNYANDIGGKIKFVGNSIKSKKMPAYIEDFLSVAIRLLLDGKGKEFINFYFDYVDKIYNYNIPLVKIASKSKVKSSIDSYKLNCKKKNKAGNPMPRQAHMELAMREGLDLNLGDTLYYVNTGTSKSQGDLKTLVKSKMTKKELFDYESNNGHAPKFDTEVQLNCKLIPSDVVDFNMETMKEIDRLKKILKDTTDEDKIAEYKNTIQEFESQLLTEEYNVAKYLESFNKKVEPLLVCFHTDIRHKILLTIKKDKKTKFEKLEDKQLFTEQQCTLVSGMPDKPEDQDTYEELMTMEDKEIKFWVKVNKIPNNIDENEWELVKEDYIQRMILERELGIVSEKEKLDDIFRHLELNELRKIETDSIIPSEVLIIAEIDYDTEMFVSRKWSEPLCPFLDIFKYEHDAIERDKWYQLMNNSSDDRYEQYQLINNYSDDRYEQWLEYKSQNEEPSVPNPKVVVKDLSLIKDKIQEIEKAIVKVEENIDVEEDEDSDIENEYNPESLDSEIDNYIPELQKADFEIESGKEQSLDTKSLLENIMNTPLEEDDEWNF
jgi:DNA polymerase elongation subunit (family B)